MPIGICDKCGKAANVSIADACYDCRNGEKSMSISFNDGEVFGTDDWTRMKRLIAEKAKEGKSPEKIVSSDGVTVKLGNLKVKNDMKMPLANPNYIEGKYKGWTIRVWRDDSAYIYGCNYFKDNDARYLERQMDDCKDEFSVFKFAEKQIDKIEASK